jgi:hypothetical protein
MLHGIAIIKNYKNETNKNLKNHSSLYWENFHVFYFITFHSMAVCFLIIILTSLCHIFWLHMSIFYMWQILMSSIQKSITWVQSFYYNSSIIIIKFIATWMIEKLTMLMLNIILYLKFIYTPEKLLLWQSNNLLNYVFSHILWEQVHKFEMDFICMKYSKIFSRLCNQWVQIG